jgi:hypothetical protein
VTHHPAASANDTPIPESRTQSTEERDTLNDTPELRFLRDEIEALLGSATARRAMHAPSINEKPALTPTSDDSLFERDTEPSVDVQLLREAVRAAGK